MNLSLLKQVYFNKLTGSSHHTCSESKIGFKFLALSSEKDEPVAALLGASSIDGSDASSEAGPSLEE
eukprot:3813808-Pleurochrysis_carterae.AAC.1